MPDIPVKIDRLYADTQFLTNISPPRNYSHLDSLQEALDYITAEFEKMGIEPEFQRFELKGDIYTNVMISFGPRDGERVIVGAHYDVDGDTPGADDNACAVAGLLEIARLFTELKPKLKYRTDFVAYTLEEAPNFRGETMGSFVHARSLADNLVKLKAMVCLEMIGYFDTKPGSQRYPISQLSQIYPDTANFIGVVGKQGQEELVGHMDRYMKEAGGIPVFSISAPPGLNEMLALSDHINYWSHGYEAVMITDTSFYRNPNYHLPSDTIDTLDFERMAEVVKGVYWGVVNF
jgi:Zn-dependent M28 family amino/carboxypeptidase